MAVGKPAWKTMWVISVAISPARDSVVTGTQLSRKLVGPGRGLLRRRALPSCGPAGRGRVTQTSLYGGLFISSVSCGGECLRDLAQ